MERARRVPMFVYLCAKCLARYQSTYQNPATGSVIDRYIVPQRGSVIIRLYQGARTHARSHARTHACVHARTKERTKEYTQTDTCESTFLARKVLMPAVFAATALLIGARPLGRSGAAAVSSHGPGATSARARTHTNTKHRHRHRHRSRPRRRKKHNS